ncbi:hypothetical protein ASE86_05210 [Sphingomonas sp. Leaf33]|uniref:hypothetical protein n=1 Tax=Sphingomonas sp. Leaf33 TaxID=1736215 RepID=UPI0006FF8944|nr:hypothetical protein [Sphingomonas sp. Leaf33]KQN25614.1 hypothetical protein ASE86_05210 [Sphingomonas sp. Leaf33]
MQDTIDTTARDRAADLLARHPHLNAAETAEIVQFLAKGPIIDRGMLRGDPAYAATIDAIQSDHARHFRASLPQIVGVIALMTVPIALMLWVAIRYG